MIDVEVSARSATCALFSSLPAWAAGQYVQFSFSPEWNGLQKTVYISNGSENIERLLARDDETLLGRIDTGDCHQNPRERRRRRADDGGADARAH